MAYHLYTSNQLSTFIPILAEVTLSHSLFSPGLVICQNKQLTNRLKTKITDINGICGNIDFIDQNKARQTIMSFYTKAQAKYKNHFVPDIVTFKLLLLKLFKETNGSDSLLEHYFKVSTDDKILSVKHLSLASEVSRLFDSYNKTNHKMIDFWNHKKLISDPHNHDFEHERWQQKLMFEIFNNHNLISYDAVFQEIIRNQELPSEKKTICIVGSAFLLENNLDFLHYISNHHDIHHFCWTPCQTYFGDLRNKNDYQEISLDNKTNSLLSNLGKLGRDLQNKLLDLEDIIDNSLFIANDDNSLLSRIQKQILSGINPLISREEISQKDINIEIVNAPSKLREVEILYDNVLDILNNSSDIYPQDIFILAKDINEYESLIKTVFSRKINSYQGEASLKLPLTFIDIMAMSHSSMIKGTLNILDIIKSNFSVVSILQLFQNPVFMAKFSLKNKDIDFFSKTIKKLNITSFFKEGVDAFSQEDDTQAHWHTIFKRILSGFLMNDEQEMGGTLPFTEIILSEYEPVFKLIDVSLNLLKDLKDFAVLKVDIKTWAMHFRNIIIKYLSVRDDFIDRDEKFRKKIFNILEYCSDLTDKIPDLNYTNIDFLSFDNILTEKISTLTTSVHVNKGNGISFASIRNNRLLPAKVVCLLGMNESVFPSKTSSFNFDLRKLDQSILDAEITDVDKYCFLEILTTTKEKLILSYIGKDDANNVAMNPSILLEELIEYVDSNFIVKNIINIKELFVKTHPLDGFNNQYFDKTDSFFSYNSLNFRTCHFDYEKTVPALLPAMLDMKNNVVNEDLISISITDLKQFLKNPVKFFIKNKLKIYFDEKENSFTNSEQFFSLSSLKQYQFFKYILDNIHFMNKKELSKQVVKFIRYQTKDGSLAGDVIAKNQQKLLLQEVDILKETFTEFPLHEKRRCFLTPQGITRALFISHSSDLKNLKSPSLMLNLEGGKHCEIFGQTNSYYDGYFINVALKEVKPKHFVDSMVDYLILKSSGFISDHEVKSLVYGIKKQKLTKKKFNLSQAESISILSIIANQMMQDLNNIYFADIDCCHTVVKTRNPDTIQSRLFTVMENKAKYCSYINEFLKATTSFNQNHIADFAKKVYKGLII